MITEVSIYNFKSIQEVKSLKLRPLTLLTGVNSSGKSNIMEATSFFAQASRYRETQGAQPTFLSVYFTGEMKRYPQPIEQFIAYKRNPNGIVTLEINVVPDKSLVNSIRDLLENNIDAVKYVFPDGPTTRTIPETLIKTVGYSVSFRFSDSYSSQKTLINENPLVEVQRTKVTYPDGFKNAVARAPTENIFSENVFQAGSGSNTVLDVLLEISCQVINYVRSYAEGIYFISGERGQINPEKSIGEPPHRPTPSWVGFNGQDLMEILSRCFTREPEKFEKIQEWAKRFQLLGIRAGYAERNILESNFRDDTLSVNLNSTLAGLGSRQILSIITQIFWSKAGDVIMIEEPEISLHPEKQVLLHELFAEAISQSKQIICSTHSPFFVLALSKIIKNKSLTLNDIEVYHVVKDKNGTHAESLPLNKNGFVEKGIPSFMVVEKDLFKDWSDSLEEE